MIIKGIKEKIGNLQDAFKKEDIPPMIGSILSGECPGSDNRAVQAFAVKAQQPEWQPYQ